MTATVTAGATGHVTFYDGGTIAGIAKIVNGKATLVTSLLPAGAHSLVAHYAGDGTYLPSSSTTQPLTVNTVPVNNFHGVASFGSGNRPVVVDLNLDGKPDLVTVVDTGVSVMLGLGDGTFLLPITYSVAPNTISVAVGDFNGDGIPDLAVSGSGFVNIMLGLGDGTFTVPLGTQVSATAGYLAVADFNGDGNADLIDSSGVLRLGNGDGSFQTPHAAFPGLNIAGSIIAATDFNGDGKADLLVEIGSTTLSVLLGNGDGTFRTPITALLNFGAVAAVAGDFNGDGKTDIAAIGSSGADCLCNGGDMAILLGNGDGSFQPPNRYSTSGTSLAVADLNGDGKQDLIAPTSFAIFTGLEVWLGNGNGTFQPPTGFSGSVNLGPSTVAIADVNGDGRTDIVYASPGVFVLLGGSSPDLTISTAHLGSFTANSSGEYVITVANLPFAATSGVVTVTDTLPLGVAASSMSGIGWTCSLGNLTCTRPDALAPNASYPPIVIAVGLSSTVPGTITNTAVVSGGGDSNSGNNTSLDSVLVRSAQVIFTSSPNPSALDQPIALTAAVTAGATGQIIFYDGATVLGVSSLSFGVASIFPGTLTAGTHTLHARFVADPTSFYASNNSTFLTQTVTGAAAAGFQPPLTFGQLASTFLALGDADGDTKTDLITSQSRTDQLVTALLSNGDGSFRTQATPLASPTPLQNLQGVTVADLDGDGRVDIVGSTKFTDTTSQIVALFSIGGGSFSQPRVLAGGGRMPVVADFNGDGKNDIAYISGLVPTDLTVLLNNGPGNFAPPLTLHLTDIAKSMVVGDFNADGRPDVAVAYESQGLDSLGRAVELTVTPISVFLGNGDGTFRPPLLTTVRGSGALVLGDFNNDGRADLAVGTIGATPTAAPSGTILLSRGDGTFQTTNTTFAGTPLVAGDLNGDAKADLVIVNGSSVSLLTGNGDGSFKAPSALPVAVGASPSAVIADFNTDNKSDLAVSSSNGLVVLFGSTIVSTGRINLTVWRPSEGNWYVNQINQSPLVQSWGLPGDIPMSGNMEHDGKLTVWRPSNGTWYVTQSGNPASQVQQQWGLTGDIPVGGDFDGDGKQDFAVWRPSNATWYILPSSNPGVPIIKQWGDPADIPVIGDFDGDRKTDFAVWSPSTGLWHILLSSTGATVVQLWGVPGDIPVPADYDGDGKTDFAIWRPTDGNWWIIPSTTGIGYVRQWGFPGDIPVPRDYDQDGKADLAVWRPSNGTWFILPFATPTVPTVVQWGLMGDIPVYRPIGQ